jgi:hypothetical protein
MNRYALVSAMCVALAACSGDKKAPAAVLPPQDTTPMNLGSVQSAIPPAAPDTFTPPVARPVRARAAIPPAPAELMQVVEREQSFSKFCYQEFGQKVDPSLSGGVAMVVTVESNAISDARVQDDSWSSQAGKAVNNCLNSKAANAWKQAAGSVRPGKYVVQLSFRPS